jgi:hypothetical protein
VLIDFVDEAGDEIAETLEYQKIAQVSGPDD